MDDQTDAPRASPEGYGADDRWMSYRELGLSRGISRASAARLAHRHRWRKRTDNDGTVRVLVPHGQDTPADRHPADVGRGRDADITGMSRAVNVLETAVATLRERAEAAERRAEAAEKGREGDQLRADELRAQIEALNTQLAAARKAVDGADELRRQADTWTAMGRWARLRAAWRGQ